jgi:ATP adenylyltransferase
MMVDMDDEQADAPGAYAGEPDGFERLWTPHRMVYLEGEDKPTEPDPGPGCPFCRVQPEGQGPDDDERLLVVARGAECFAVLNLYPYNPGHLMVCPYRHVADYPNLTTSETAELAAMTQAAMRVLEAVSAPHGFNLGMNQGGVAGAGIAAHLHQHVVPRWGGDSNFLPIVGRTKALPQLLGDTRQRVAEAWSAGRRASAPEG